MTATQSAIPGRICLIAMMLCLGAGAAVADQPAQSDAMIELKFPEQLDLKVLIDYIAKRNNINFIYDSPHIVGKKVTIVASEKIPADSLMSLLESVLATKGLVMSPSAAGMIRIEKAKPLTQTSTGPIDQEGVGDSARPNQAVTRVIRLDHARPEQVEQVIKPFMSAATANLTRLDEHGIVIVTDYGSNMKRLGELIALVDQPPKDISLEFVPIEHLEADAVRTQLNTLMQGRAKARGSQGDFTILADSRTNKLIVLGPAGQVSDALDLIKSLDVPLGLERVVYAPKVAAAERLNRLIRDSLDPLEADRLYRSTVDSQSNILIATTTAEIHGQIESILEAIDKPAPASQSPIRFYKLENAKATDVLATLRSIEGETGLQGVSIDGLRAKPAEAQEDELPIRGPTPEQINRQAGPRRDSSKGGAVELPDARVMADEPSNTLIVIARPEMHPIYEKLIRRLDIRRPQVLIETVIVSIDTTDGFSLGVELSRRDEVNDGEGTVLNFSSFGLSTVEDDARLTIDPGIGFNGTLISADIADVIVRALKSDSRARVISRPSLLINDNATGTLSSESEEPFSSVNASTSVATTSFGGYSSAGTKITMTPQISEGRHLKLEYEVTLSSFGEEVSENLPPSRQANTLSSEATIPDGYTIIVGGLTREDSSESVDRVPLLGQIPVLEYLFSNRSRSTKQQTLFVFIQATILRDDEFSGLKMLSAQAARDAELADTYPTSNAVEIP